MPFGANMAVTALIPTNTSATGIVRGEQGDSACRGPRRRLGVCVGEGGKERYGDGGGGKSGCNTNQELLDWGLGQSYPVLQHRLTPLPRRLDPPHFGKAAPRGGVAYFNGGKWLQVGSPADSQELTFSAWIYLPNVPQNSMPGTSASMKTIAATKVLRLGLRHAASAAPQPGVQLWES